MLVLSLIFIQPSIPVGCCHPHPWGIFAAQFNLSRQTLTDTLRGVASMAILNPLKPPGGLTHTLINSTPSLCHPLGMPGETAHPGSPRNFSSDIYWPKRLSHPLLSRGGALWPSQVHRVHLREAEVIPGHLCRHSQQDSGPSTQYD